MRSLFVLVSLYDELTIEAVPQGCEIESNCPFPSKENILYKAWELCCEQGFYSGGLKLTLQKNIPSGAGLGGGSGNAATLLRTLYEHSDKRRSLEEWTDLSARLGSDVPFFMDSAAAVVTGRGEHVKTIEPRLDYHLVIVYPHIFMGTPQAFSELDNRRVEQQITHEWALLQEDITFHYHNSPPHKWPFFNSFTPTAYKNHPQLKKIEKTLLTLGADFASLSGSGSAMVGVYMSEEQALLAKNTLQDEFPLTYSVIPLDIIPFCIVR